MPQTKVNTPDGRVIKVNHPEGATEEEILRYAAMNDSKPPEESYVEGVSRRYKETDFAETVGEFMPELERRLDIKRIPDAPGMPGTGGVPFGEKVTTTISQVARTGGELTVEALAPLIPNFIRKFAGDSWEYLSNTETGQEALLAISSGYESWKNWSEANPKLAAEITESLGTTLDLGALFSPRPDLDDLAKRIRAAGIQTDIDKKKEALTSLLEPETFTAQDRVELRGPLGESVWVPSEFDQTMIDAVQTIPNIKPYGSVRKNFTIMQDHVSDQADKLTNYVKSQNKKIDFDDINEEFYATAKDFMDSDVFALASKSAQKAFNNYVTLAQKIIKEEGTDLNGILKARRRFDDAVHRAGQTVDADVATYQAEAAKLVRGVLNDFLKSNTKGDEVHHLLDQQFRTLTAMDRLVNKRNREGRNAIARITQTIKDEASIVLPKTVLSIVATTGAVMAPSVAVPLIGGAIGTAFSTQIKRHGKSAVLKAYANLLSATDKAIKAVSDPTKLEALELDRLILIDVINDIRNYEEPKEDG